MSAPHPTTSRTLVVGLVLVLLGLAGWAFYALQSRGEKHSYTDGGPPPPYVQVTAGHTYWLAIPDGVGRETSAGLAPGKLTCSVTEPGQAPRPLAVTAETSDSKATNQIGSFTPDFSGSVSITCDHLGAVFVDDAQDAQFDWSGMWVILGSLALAVGLPLTLSGLRRPRGRYQPGELPVAIS